MTTAASLEILEPMNLEPLTVLENRAETPDTSTLTLDSHGLTFLPGQFMMLYAFGVGEVPISIAGNPWMTETLMHTIRAVGPVTDALCAVGEGEVIGGRGPYGTSWPIDEQTEDLVIIAGGIGLAPLRPAIVEALARRDRLRHVSLIYGARSPEDLLYKDDLLGWVASPDIEVAVTVDRATSDWWGNVGLVTSLLPRVGYEPGHTSAFVCGPEVMMRVVARALRDTGVAPERTWVSLERNMQCGIGLCGHCQYGPDLLCRSGPVVRYDRVASRLLVDEL